jgi:hypothetical protein
MSTGGPGRVGNRTREGEKVSERRAAEEGSDGPEPTESAPRLKRQGMTTDERPTRVSVRPSAFGPPRPSSRPPEPPASGEAELPAQGEASTPTGSVSQVSLPPPPRAARPTSVEELAREEADERDPLTNSQFATRLSQLPAVEPARVPGSGSGRARRPWLSIVIFGGMLSLSAVSLLRFLNSADEDATPPPGSQASEGAATAQPQAAPRSVASPAAPAEISVEGSAEAKQQTIMALVAEANRVLDAGDAPQAERMFGQVVAIDEDNPRAAYGLSRIRLLQGNLSGAEGWIQLAIRKRPRRAAYHAHYAAILERLGNHDEAHVERLRAQGGSESDE